MMNNNHHHNRNWLRWAARIWGTTVASFWGLTLLLHAVGDAQEIANEPFMIEGLVLSLLVIAAVLATVHAWTYEFHGGIALLVVGMALAVFALMTAGRNHWFAVAVSGLPFVVSGMLFLGSVDHSCRNCS